MCASFRVERSNNAMRKQTEILFRSRAQSGEKNESKLTLVNPNTSDRRNQAFYPLFYADRQTFRVSPATWRAQPVPVRLLATAVRFSCAPDFATATTRTYPGYSRRAIGM